MALILNRADLEKDHYSSRSLKTSLSALEFCILNSDPKKLVENAVKLRNSKLLLTDIRNNITKLNLDDYESIYVVGAGKAAAKMLDAVSKILKKRLSGGAITVPHDSVKTKIDNAIKTRHVKVTEAGHPLPDEAGVQGATKIVELLRKTTEFDLIFCLVSGGGSALLPLPLKGISLQDKQKITNAMLSAGATINEVNVIRKHLSQVKGGRLVRYVKNGCTVLTLILSDVIGDEMDIIASGPTIPDRSTFQDAADVLKKYGLWQKPFTSVRMLITKGINGEIEDTPKEGDPIFETVHNILIGNNSLLCDYAAKYLTKHVSKVTNLGSSFGGEAREFGYFLADLSKDVIRSRESVALVMGGETTVKLNRFQRNGMGGRNQEAVLSAALKCRFPPTVDMAILCMGTDGVDGNSKAAGAILTPKTISRIKGSSVDVKEYMDKHDSYNALKKLRSLIVTGRTGTNVNDISIICKMV
ncbi:MAG: glycerate kinase [Candidatus Nitrosopolaris sp.]